LLDAEDDIAVVGGQGAEALAVYATSRPMSC
jgi:hypothetical protein